MTAEIPPPSSRRFRCLRCDREGPMFLRPTANFPQLQAARSTSIHVMDPQGHFCRLRCAAEYGVAAAPVFVAREERAKRDAESANKVSQ